MPLDIALGYDPVNRRCDAVFTGTDFALDTSYQTPVLMAMGCDRRAHPDDELPQPTLTLPANAPLENWKRGWPGDMLDPRGELTGSRAWVLGRSKLDERVRRRAQSIDAEALGSLTGRQGVQIGLTVELFNRNTLAHRVITGTGKITLAQVVGS